MTRCDDVEEDAAELEARFAVLMGPCVAPRPLSKSSSPFDDMTDEEYVAYHMGVLFPLPANFGQHSIEDEPEFKDVDNIIVVA